MHPILSVLKPDKKINKNLTILFSQINKTALYYIQHWIETRLTLFLIDAICLWKTPYAGSPHSPHICSTASIPRSSSPFFKTFFTAYTTRARENESVSLFVITLCVV